MLRQVEELIAANIRLRQILVDRGIIPPGDATPPVRAQRRVRDRPNESAKPKDGTGAA